METANIILVAIAVGIFIGWLIAEMAEDCAHEKLLKQLGAKDDELVRCHALIDELQADNNALCLGSSKTDVLLLIDWH